MKTDYSIEVCTILKKRFANCNLHRPMVVERYDDGETLTYEVTSVVDRHAIAQVQLKIDTFVGGGFAGQVYRVIIKNIDGCKIPGLKENGRYAMKILIPPSKGAIIFRNCMYRIGFQGSFQLQTNPIAARSGAIWQKLIKQGAEVQFHRNTVVNDIHGTFIDSTLGSCGELSDWVEGRTWKLEVDERLDYLRLWERGKNVDLHTVGSPEYRSKKIFMRDFVNLLHTMGAHEFARQYEWSTWKSQPNCLKLTETDDNPKTGLVAVDFRAGLALLPFAPMSPGDIKLIFEGLGRGSLVQFDRGDINKLHTFIENHREEFKGTAPMLEELVACEKVYRNSVFDITHNHLRLFYDKTLWSTILQSTATGWRVKNLIDSSSEKKLFHNKPLTLLLIFFGSIPFFGGVIKKFWGNSNWRSHYLSMFTHAAYLKRTIKGKTIEKAISWHRAERIEKVDALNIPESYLLFLLHLFFSLFPPGLHKFLTNWNFCKERLDYILIRPFRLYFVMDERENWLREMIEEGKKKYIIDDNEAQIILSKIKEPFIQKYLKSLAVHVCTVPVTQVISVIVSWIYVRMHPDMSVAEATTSVAAILILFQITPISPGSLTRGFYVLYLVIKERNFKDYNIAVFLGFFKYIGYLAFPIQMAYRYPILARFMAGHWATEAVHIIPVFGESGALLERYVFCLFYNWPLTIWRRIRDRTERRKTQKARYWHTGLYVLILTAILGFGEYGYSKLSGDIPINLSSMWWLLLCVPLSGGIGITLGCGGATLWQRIITTVIFGIVTGMLYSILSSFFISNGNLPVIDFIAQSLWKIFVVTVISCLGAIGTELIIK